LISIVKAVNQSKNLYDRDFVAWAEQQAEDSPSLQRFLQDPDWIAKYYRRARREAAKEIQLAIATLPKDCPHRSMNCCTPICHCEFAESHLISDGCHSGFALPIRMKLRFVSKWGEYGSYGSD
jgi:hypothetical protein